VASHSLVLAPTADGFRTGIHEGHTAPAIRGYERILDVAQRHTQPLLAFVQLLFHLMLIEGDLDRRL
jgi:hypothetical protein